MKILTEEEFNDRTQAVLRAQRIFIDSGVTNNVGVAFKLYQEICAERERQIFISSQQYGNKSQRVMNRYHRPKCPDCEHDMHFRTVPENNESIKLQLVCSNPECDTVLNSENDLDWWQANLKVKNGS